jgi:hypothetical protein
VFVGEDPCLLALVAAIEKVLFAIEACLVPMTLWLY